MKAQNSPLTNDEKYSNISPSMPKHAPYSFTKGVAMALPARYAKKIRITYSVITSILLVFLGSVYLYAQQSSKPPLEWTPKKVESIVLPNTTTNVTVSFKTSFNMTNVAISPNSGLKDVLSVSPANFPGITANQNYSVTLVVRAGNTSGVKYSGTVHLRDMLGTATTAMPLPVTVVIHNEPVPPDPGEAGKVTLEGIDLDNDGVRDDLHRWIVLNYYYSQKRMAALRQFVKSQQISLIDANDKVLSVVHSKERQRAAECSDYIFGLDSSIRARRELRAQLLNTEARSRAYIKADSQLGGTFGLVIPDDRRKAQCQFDPDLMEN